MTVEWTIVTVPRGPSSIRGLQMSSVDEKGRLSLSRLSESSCRLTPRRTSHFFARVPSLENMSHPKMRRALANCAGEHLSWMLFRIFLYLNTTSQRPCVLYNQKAVQTMLPDLSGASQRLFEVLLCSMRIQVGRALDAPKEACLCKYRQMVNYLQSVKRVQSPKTVSPSAF